MSKKIQISLEYNRDLEQYLHKKIPALVDFRILKKGLDARGANRGRIPKYNYSIEYIVDGESFPDVKEQFYQCEIGGEDGPIIVGMGPAGLFCAIRLLEYGITSTLIERGDKANRRMSSIAKYWKGGKLDPDNNICFGEGGAGLFSDGKLMTRIKSPYVQYVLDRLVDFGAPEETAYLQHPHLGTNKMQRIISNISEFLERSGCTIRRKQRVVELQKEEGRLTGVKLQSGEVVKSSTVVLATGHSARDVYRSLHESGISLESKDFAVGVRIEHPREMIDRLQFGKFAKNLPAAEYRFSYHNKKSDRGTFSFCMCPGGVVLSAGTEADGLVVNGMSNSGRNSKWSNSAIVVSVKSGVDFSDAPLAGIDFQREIEHKAYLASRENANGFEVPAQAVAQFLSGKSDPRDLSESSVRSGLFHFEIEKLFPKFIVEHLKEGLKQFDKRLAGFAFNQALLIAPETRTSSPVRVLRDRESFQSTSLENLYPCGEGAGYAGGITSSAVDGVAVATKIAESLKRC